MSIPQLLSGDPSEDLDYSYSKSQNGSDISAGDKDSAATATDVNTDIDARDSAQTIINNMNLTVDELGLGND
ncbi:2204_t:CDS:2 [Rhizophagus irregularis]|nr:2204_t:CDS:2 [Rhizophagus irregularis]